MGVFLSPLWFHIKTHHPYTRRTQATPLKSQNSAACRKQCRCQAKPVTICTLHSCHLPDKSCFKPGKATTGGTLHFEPPTKGYEVTWPHLLLPPRQQAGALRTVASTRHHPSTTSDHRSHSEDTDFHQLYYTYRSGLHLLKNDFHWQW